MIWADNMKYVITKVVQFSNGFSRRLRYGFAKFRLGSLGRGTHICSGVKFTDAQNIFIGSNVVINDSVIIQSCERAKVIIGNDVNISYGCMLLTGGLDLSYRISGNRKHIGKNITIGNRVWIGAGAVILPGVSIHDGAVIGAGAVVTKNVESNTVVVGAAATKFESKPIRAN